jgi:hypothetical protein
MHSDSTLALDNLQDFFPAVLDPDADATLAVSALHELFPAAPPTIIWQSPPPEQSETRRALEQLDDFFPASPQPACAPVDVDNDDLSVNVDGLSMDIDEALAESEIQRAALEFQRFAERFHAFASACRPGAVHPQT